MTNLNRYYEILGLQPGASQMEVKQAYRDLAKMWHPDRFVHDPRLKQEAEEKLKHIIEAYQHLKDLKDHQVPAAQPPDQGRSPVSPPPRPGISVRLSGAEAFYQQGAEKVKAGHYREALDDFSTAIRLDPNYAAAYRYRGFVHSLLGFELGAESDLRKAKRLELERQVSTADGKPGSAGNNWRHRAGSPFSPQRPAHAAPATSTQPVPPLNWKDVQTLSGHRDAVTAIAVSRDAKLVVSASRDATIQFWNLQTGNPLGTLSGHQAAVCALAISADRQLLVSGSADHTIKLWHLQTGRPVLTLRGHRDSVQSLAISPDGQFLVSGGRDGMVRIWRCRNGELLHVLDDHTAPVYAIALSPDGQIIYSGGENQTLRLHRLRTGELLRSLPGTSATLFTIGVSADGRYFATGGNDWQVRLWDDSSVVTGDPVAVFPEHRGNVRAIAFSPTHPTFASGSDDHTIRFWTVNQEAVGILTQHGDAVTSLAYSMDGKLLISSSEDKTIKIWQQD